MSEVLRIPEGFNPAAYAVADAMMMVQAAFMLGTTSRIKGYRFQEEQDLTMDKKLQNVSAGNCESACLEAIRYLNEKHRGLFQNMAMLRSFGNLRDAFGLEMTFHDNFLVKDKTGIWHAGSPANHTARDEKSRMTRIVSSHNLQDVLDKLREYDKAELPTAGFIEETFEASPIRLPHVNSRKSMEVLRFFGHDTKNPRSQKAQKILV